MHLVHVSVYVVEATNVYRMKLELKLGADSIEVIWRKKSKKTKLSMGEKGKTKAKRKE